MCDDLFEGTRVKRIVCVGVQKRERERERYCIVKVHLRVRDGGRKWSWHICSRLTTLIHLCVLTHLPLPYFLSKSIRKKNRELVVCVCVRERERARGEGGAKENKGASEMWDVGEEREREKETTMGRKEYNRVIRGNFEELA